MQDIERGTGLNHKNIIRCFKCWASNNQINLITELFTSGNLRDYRHEHKQLDSSALRKFCRQILLGLDYLHSQSPAVIHGDLRCDKIYVNGHSGACPLDPGRCFVPRRLLCTQAAGLYLGGWFVTTGHRKNKYRHMMQDPLAGVDERTDQRVLMKGHSDGVDERTHWMVLMTVSTVGLVREHERARS